MPETNLHGKDEGRTIKVTAAFAADDDNNDDDEVKRDDDDCWKLQIKKT